MGHPAEEAVSATQHRSAVGAWERAWQRPSRPLRGLVTGYTGFWQRLATPAPHRGIPSPTLSLVISFGPPLTIAAPDSARPAATVDSFVAGLHDRYVLIDADVHHGIQVDLHPVGAYRLLGLPLRELAREVVPLEALLGPEAGRLVDDLASAADWPARFRRLDRFLLDRFTDDRAPAPEVAWTHERILAARGRVLIGELAAEAGWSQRHLAARFADVVGLSPKRMARLVRFDHAATLLGRPGAGGLAEIALGAGYYDQAHLANEVRAFTGLSATQLLARRLPDSGGVFDLDGS